MSAPLAEIGEVSRRFAALTVLDRVSLDIPAGGYSVLLGPSGSGKTTLLNILGGFLEPSEGSVRIDGEDVTRVPPARRPTATVFQDYALFPHMSVAANVGFGLRMRGAGKAAREARTRDMLALVGLSDMRDRKPHQLSGGQRQRVALARALAVGPKLLLLDEPLGALDLKLRRQMQDELKAIQRRTATTFVHVTHDQEEAMALGDLVVVMNRGRIEDRGPPERVYLRPATMFTAGFMGASNFLEGVVRAADAKGMAVETSIGTLALPRGDAKRGQRVVLSMRPEQFASPRQGLLDLGEIAIEDAVFAGTHVAVRGSHTLDPAFRPMVNVIPGAAPQAGGRLRLAIDPAAVVTFPRD